MISHVPGGKQFPTPQQSSRITVESAPPVRRAPRREGVDWIETLENSLARYPALAVVVGLSIGVWFGWLIKRRHGE